MHAWCANNTNSMSGAVTWWLMLCKKLSHKPGPSEHIPWQNQGSSMIEEAVYCTKSIYVYCPIFTSRKHKVLYVNVAVGAHGIDLIWFLSFDIAMHGLKHPGLYQKDRHDNIHDHFVLCFKFNCTLLYLLNYLEYNLIITCNL